VQRALELLAEAKEISDKVIGKQKIYYANQDLLPTADDSELRAFDERIKAGGERLKEVQAKVKTLETRACVCDGLQRRQWACCRDEDTQWNNEHSAVGQ